MPLGVVKAAVLDGKGSTASAFSQGEPGPGAFRAKGRCFGCLGICGQAPRREASAGGGATRCTSTCRWWNRCARGRKPVTGPCCVWEKSPLCAKPDNWVASSRRWNSNLHKERVDSDTLAAEQAPAVGGVAAPVAVWEQLGLRGRSSLLVRSPRLPHRTVPWVWSCWKMNRVLRLSPIRPTDRG